MWCKDWWMLDYQLIILHSTCVWHPPIRIYALPQLTTHCCIVPRISKFKLTLSVFEKNITHYNRVPKLTHGTEQVNCYANWMGGYRTHLLKPIQWSPLKGHPFWEDRFAYNFLVSYENYYLWKDTPLVRTENSKFGSNWFNLPLLGEQFWWID